MPVQLDQQKNENFEQFRDAFSAAVIEKVSAPERQMKARKRQRPNRTGPSRSSNTPQRNISDTSTRDADDLADFTDYIATLAFESLPPELQTLTHHIWAASSPLQAKYNLPLLTGSDVSEHMLHTLDPDIAESLITYGIISPPAEDMATFLTPVLICYLTAVTSPPPAADTARGKVCECEICGRGWVPLTYHHLIPRFVHAKAVKRGWHRAEDLQSVAWLCRACHSFVHRFAGHEALAREYFTVDRLLEQEQIRSFAAWVSRVRWKAR